MYSTPYNNQQNITNHPYQPFSLYDGPLHTLTCRLVDHTFVCTIYKLCSTFDSESSRFFYFDSFFNLVIWGTLCDMSL